MTDGEAGSIIFRAHKSEDLNFILDSWGRSVFSGTSAKKYVTPEEFHSFHRPQRMRFFSKPNTTCIVCVPDDDLNQIIGWIAVESIPSGLILHYLYVKDVYKKQGIATMLIKRALPTSPIFYTHLTEQAARILSRHQDRFRGFKYMPHLV